MPNLRTIATSTAVLVLLLSCNRILPTKAATDDDGSGYNYDNEALIILNVTCASADPSVFTSPACYTLVSYVGIQSIFGDVNGIWGDYLYEFYGQELEGGPVDASVDEPIGRAVKMGFYAASADSSYCWVNIGSDDTCICSICDTDADDWMPTTFRIDCSHIDGGINASDTCVELAPYPPIYDPHLGKDNDDFSIITIDHPVEGYVRDFGTISNLNVTCASADPSVFTSPVCYTLVSNVTIEYFDGVVTSVQGKYLYEFYGQELEGDPVDASVDERIGGAVTMEYYNDGADYSYCRVKIGTDDICICSPCDTDADGLMPITLRIDCSYIDGGINASDTCVEFVPYPPIYDPHLGKNNNITAPTKNGSLFRRFGGRVDKIFAYLKSILPSFRRGKRND
jgi:hypothetical protein